MTPKPKADEAAVAEQRERLATTTSVEAALTGYGRVLSEVRDFESRLDRLFERLDEARTQVADRAGVDVAPRLSKAMNSAYAAWLARREAGTAAGPARAPVPDDAHQARRMIGEPPAEDAPPVLVDGELIVYDHEGETQHDVGAWPMRNET